MNLQQNFDAVSRRIRDAEAAAGRPQGCVQLIAVSKTKPASAIHEMASFGQRAFGENYLQEALEKQSELSDLGLEWHFIGAIQSNKTRDIATHFDWVHSVDRLKIARRMSDQRPVGLPPLNMCVEVNISNEASKSGVLPGEVLALAQSIKDLPNVSLRGLMAIPQQAHTYEEQLAIFNRMLDLLDELNKAGLDLDTLSMGMSSDMEAAIAAGATMVRIGTDLFGARDYSTLKREA